MILANQSRRFTMGSLKHYLFATLLLLTGSTLAQKVTVSGIVTDGPTKKPLPFVSVYFNNTTLGSTTDSLGRFKIERVPIGQTELTASFIGYKTLKINLPLKEGKNNVVEFRMIPAENLLGEIVVHSKKERNEELEAFIKVFIGTTANANQTRIVNPEVLYFKGDPDVIKDESNSKSSFEAFANEPLIVANDALGYKLTISLTRFEVTAAGYEILISTRFDTLTTSSSNKRLSWKRNRINTYKGSLRHLFASVIAGNSEGEGFRIDGKDPNLGRFNPGVINLTSSPSLLMDSTKGNYEIFRKGVYQITYFNKILPKRDRLSEDNPYPTSQIEVVDPSLKVDKWGVLKLANIVTSGYFFTLRIADLLPTNYDPPESEAELDFATKTELSSIEGTVLDDKGTPLQKAEVFINKGLTKTTTDEDGKFKLENVHPGRYPIAFAYNAKKAEVKIIDVSSQRSSKVVVILKDRNPIPKTETDPLFKVHQSIFEQQLLENSQIFFRGFRIVNRDVLRFVKRNRVIEVSMSAPLEIENTELGYRWTYYTDHAILRRRGSEYRLQISGAIKMDTLTTKNSSTKRKWVLNRYDKYQGSWNDFATSLANGNLELNGFSPYVLKKDFGRKRPKFSKILDNELQSIESDSILVAEQENLFLIPKKGLEIHYNYEKPFKKYYKKYGKQVLRIRSDSSQIKISRTGVFNPEEISIEGIKQEILPRVPVDYQIPFQKVTNPKVLLIVKEKNLRAVKELQEKVYVQTDKPYYYPGDTLWFKAFMKYANLNFADSLSKVLNVELVDSANTIIDTRILKISNGQANGDLALTTSVKAGNYAIRAYTQWMRNFSEIFIKPVPIIAINSFVESQPLDTINHNVNGVNVSLNTNKKVYATRGEVNINVSVIKDNLPQLANFSVSVVDESAVSNINGTTTIKSLTELFASNDNNLIRLTHPIEKGITLTGKILDQPPNFDKQIKKNAREKFDASSPEIHTIIALLDKKTFVKKVRGNDFRFVFDFNDTTTAILKCLNAKEQKIGLDIKENEPLKNIRSYSPLKYKIVDGNSLNQSIVKRSGANLLQEVNIKAKRIYRPNVPPTPTARMFRGDLSRVFEGESLVSLRERGNLVGFLYSIVDFGKTQQAIFNDDSQPIITGSGISISNQGPPGSIADGNTSSLNVGRRELPRAGRLYSFSLDGVPISYDQFSSIPANIISRVEVFVFSAGSGMVSIYTENTFPYVEQNYKYVIRGFDVPLSFKSPSLTSKLPDYRSTIYWNPTVSTDEHGKATFSFTTSDAEGKYLITIEGITKEGDAFRSVKEIVVKN
jgi:hypothetical protein